MSSKKTLLAAHKNIRQAADAGRISRETYTKRNLSSIPSITAGIKISRTVDPTGVLAGPGDHTPESKAAMSAFIRKRKAEISN
ncbi:hypothetical protein [Paenibacillus medicaginis]|uniref:Uncharacterized protein n=1 Tax=Paenibacillus medicaginis TaxID=1470560 RepID=A0ABV5BVV5_9BACL